MLKRTLFHLRAARDTVPGFLTLRDGGAVQINAAADGEGAGTKLRSFAMTAYTGGKMSFPYLRYPVVVDLAGVKVSKKSRPILRDHDVGRIVGHTSKIDTSGRTITVEGVISGANAHAQEIIASADSGFPWQASIGAAIHKMVLVDDGEKVTVNGRSFVGPLYVARESTLGEISFVALGADEPTGNSHKNLP